MMSVQCMALAPGSSKMGTSGDYTEKSNQQVHDQIPVPNKEYFEKTGTYILLKFK